MIPSPVHNKFPCQVMIPSDTKTRDSFWLQKKSVKVPDSTNKSGRSPNNSCCFFFLQSFHPALTFIPGWKKAHWGDDPRCSQGPWLSPMFQISQISWFQELLIVPDSSRIPGLNIQYCSRYPDFIAYPLLVPAEFERSPNFLPRQAELSDVPTSFPSNHSKCQSCRECSNSKFVVRWFRNQCEDRSSQVPQINSGLSPWLVCEHPKQNWKGKTQTACCT